MRAVGYTEAGPASVLSDVEVPDPTPGPRDLVVEVAAVSVNPVDTKVRTRGGSEDGTPKVLGYDAAGTVRAVGDEVELFSVGDEVYYAGSIARPGTNSELHVVDERIVGAKPSSLSMAEAAALPLTAITAWELLFDRLGVEQGGGEGRTLLVVGAAGGVGSILVQLARQLTALRVVGTASRPETQEWARDLGAHDVVDHSGDLAAAVRELGIEQVDLIAGLTATDDHWAAYADLVAPQGRIGVIDDPADGLDVMPLKQKCASLHWEFMFARPVHQTPDMVEQHRLLTEVARLVDDGRVRTTLTETAGEITAENVVRAHRMLESGSTRGKVVLAGWPA